MVPRLILEHLNLYIQGVNIYLADSIKRGLRINFLGPLFTTYTALYSPLLMCLSVGRVSF